MSELLLPRLKQEIEARLAELRPLIAEIEQLEAAKAALLARSDTPAAPGAAPRKPARRAAGGARRARGGAAEKGEGERAPRGANREAILTLVEERPGVSVAEIASVTKIAKATVATTVSKLKRDGVLAEEAGGVKLASRQPLTLSGPAVEQAPPREEAVTETEWDEAAPASEDAAA
jgi:Iron dependent repressor, N-terminal DNA binding domain